MDLVDGAEPRQRLQHDDGVGLPPQRLHRRGGRHGHPDHDPRRAPGPGDRHRGQRGRRGDGAVADHDDGAARQRHRGPVRVPVAGLAPHDDGLAPLRLLERHRRPGRQRDGDPVLGDGAHGDVRLQGEAHLPHHDHVQRCPQGPRDLRGHPDPAPGQREHDGVVRPLVPESAREPGPRVGAVDEEHRSRRRRGSAHAGDRARSRDGG
ncbi:hypothetical protein GCM10023200_27380 [Actinomycetospora chlora]|uniref:Uncharacterized protein n=1 Tax=Actinomycetospora chlora TaxID=663608 RepID=A0ABP9B596_9PSEU